LTRLAELSELNSDLKFDNTALTKALELVDLQARRIPAVRHYLPLPSRARDHEVPQLPAAQSAPPQQAALIETDEIAEALQECADYVRDKNLSRLRSISTWLAKQGEADSSLKMRVEAEEKKYGEVDPALKAQAEAVEGRRKRYREQIREYGLLLPHETIGARQKDLYGALLAVAFGRPLTYTGYCRVEECLDGVPDEHLHPALLHAIKDGEMAFETKALVLYLTRQERSEKELNKWYGSGELDPILLVHWLAKDWSRPHHARVICDLTLDFLLKAPTRYDQGSLRSALRQHGFLAHALQVRHPDKEQYQISVLHRFLRAIYSGTPGRQAVGQILAGTSHPPTPALLAAVVMNLSTAEAVQFALEAYVHGSLTGMNVHPDTYAQLRDRVPAIESVPYTGSESAPSQAVDQDETSEPPDQDKP
jgi:hypothetical protein